MLRGNQNGGSPISGDCVPANKVSSQLTTVSSRWTVMIALHCPHSDVTQLDACGLRQYTRIVGAWGKTGPLCEPRANRLGGERQPGNERRVPVFGCQSRDVCPDGWDGGVVRHQARYEKTGFHCPEMMDCCCCRCAYCNSECFCWTMLTQ